MNSDDLTLRIDGPSRWRWTIALAHGAGADMDSEFMRYFADQLAAVGFRVVRFEFPYMAQRRRTGRKKPPDREPVLRETWQRVVHQLGHRDLIVGGKSMGGRIASMLADDRDVAGLVCLGYPFHPIGKPDRLRIDHLRQLRTPALILQGERDPFGDRDDVARYDLPRGIEIGWMPDGDHGFKPRKRSGRTEIQNWEDAVRRISQFVGGIEGSRASS